jgi:hypothetical protein
MTLVSQFPFYFNKDETENYLRFPDLASEAKTFSVVANGTTYQIIVSWNTWLNTPMVSVNTSNGSPIAINLPLAPRISDYSPNYLADKLFRGFYLFWEPESDRFAFYRDA